MLKMGFGIATAAALLLSLPAGANDAKDDREPQYDDSQTGAAAQQSTTSDQDERRFDEGLKASDSPAPDTSSGAASGEPVRTDRGEPRQAEHRNFNEQEFLRNVWTTP